MERNDAAFIVDLVMKRIDQYILAVNSKGAILLAANTFLLDSVLLKSDIILGSVGNQKLHYVILCLSFVSMVSCVISGAFTLSAVLPFLDSGNKPGSYHSVIFFGSIAQMTEEDYISNTENGLADGTLERNDLLKQCHVLAKGAQKKYDHIRKSTLMLLWGGIMPVVSVILLRMLENLLKS